MHNLIFYIDYWDSEIYNISKINEYEMIFSLNLSFFQIIGGRLDRNNSMAIFLDFIKFQKKAFYFIFSMDSFYIEFYEVQ